MDRFFYTIKVPDTLYLPEKYFGESDLDSSHGDKRLRTSIRVGRGMED
jgi:hypothetical protein